MDKNSIDEPTTQPVTPPLINGGKPAAEPVKPEPTPGSGRPLVNMEEVAMEETETSPETDKTTTLPTAEELDEDEAVYRAIRRDLPGVKGASVAGIVSVGVAKVPGVNAFFRTREDFTPVIAIVNLEVGMEKQYYAVTDPMIPALAAIGIYTAEHKLYFTVTEDGAYRVVPVRQASEDGEQDEYSRTKEIGLLDGMKRWVRLYVDQKNKVYKVFPAPVSRFGDPQIPDIKPAKLFRLAFTDKGRLINSPQHPRFLKWAARGPNTQ